MRYIYCPIVAHSGAAVVHQQLQNHIPGYHTRLYSPNYEYLPLVMKFLTDSRADIVHTSAEYGGFYKNSKQKLILTLHNYVLDSYMSKYSTSIQKLHYKTDLRYFLNWSLPKADIVTAVSQFTADIVRRDLGFKGDILVIPNGVDQHHFFPKTSREIKGNRKVTKVLYSGNLSLRKGVQWLKLIADNLDDNIEIYYTSGLRKNDVRLEHPKLHNIGRIEHTEMPACYQNMDLLLMPTVREGLSLSALEAMASGIPLVATHCSSFPELIENGRGGYLCPPGDHLSFAKHINKLAANPELRASMGLWNRKVICSRYTQTQMINNYRELFETI